MSEVLQCPCGRCGGTLMPNFPEIGVLVCMLCAHRFELLDVTLRHMVPRPPTETERMEIKRRD